MNKTATSRQALLEAAREIARRDGLGHISIRRTAAMCGVSIGTVYNYYPAKADLVLAVIEDFWKRVFTAASPVILPMARISAPYAGRSIPRCARIWPSLSTLSCGSWQA